MEIFKLFGRIFIDNDPANRRLDETDARAAKVGNTLANTAKAAAKWGAAIAAGAAAAGTAMVALVNRVTNVGAEIDAKRKMLGITSEALQEYRYAADQVGVPLDAMERALGRLNQRIGMAERGNQKYAESLRELNVTSTDAAEAFVQAIEALHQMPDANARAAAAADLFGTQLARQLMPIIEEGGESLIALRNRAHELGLVMSQDMTVASNNFQSALADIRGIINNIAQDVVWKVLPTFERWAIWTADNIPKVWAVFQFIGEVIEIVVRHTRKALEPWVDLIGSILGVAWDWTVNLLGDAWDWLINTTWAEKWEDIKGWLTDGWNWTVNIAGRAWDWLTETTWTEKIDDIRGWFSSAWTWTVDMAGRLWAWLDEHAPWATEAIRTIRDLLLQAVKWTVDRAGDLWAWLDEKAPWLISFLETVWGFLEGGWSWTIDALGNAWQWLTTTTWTQKVEDVKSWLSVPWEWIIDIAGAAWTWLTETTWADKLDDIRGWLSSAWTWTVDMAGRAWSWLEEHAPWLTSTLETLWGYVTRAWEWTVELVGDAWNWLRDTLWPSAAAGMRTTWDFVANLLGPAWDWLRDTAWPVILAGANAAWAFSLDLTGQLWDWLRDTAWPFVSTGAKSAWSFGLELVGDLWEWLRNVAWPIITQGVSSAWDWTMDAAGAAWEWITQDGWRDTIEGIQQGFRDVQDGVVGAVTGMVQSVSEWFDAMRNSVTLHVTSIVSTVVTWFSTLRDSGVEYVKGLVEGIKDWISETKLGQTFNWLGEQVRGVTGWFYDMYDRVVGHSYVPDMVEEIGEAIERLKDRLANPVARYTADVIASFGEMEDEVVASMMRMAEAMDKVLDDMVNRVTRAIGDITRAFFNGTATWSNVLHMFAGAVGDIFGSIFDAIVKELVTNLIKQNEWLVQTLANIATTITGYLSQAYAALVAWFAWSGPAAPFLAGGVIAAALAGIASLAGSVLRGLLPAPPSSGGSGISAPTGDRGPGVGGRQVSEITGPTRDLLTDLLSPLASLNTLTGIGERIYGVLDERLPMPGLMLATAGAGTGGVHVTIERGAVQITSASGTRELDDDMVNELAERLARKIAFELRGTGRA